MTGINRFLLTKVYDASAHPRGWDKCVYDDESIHYALLQILFQASPEFTQSLLGLAGRPNQVQITVKPNAGICDMRVILDNRTHYLEIKIWNALSTDRVDRQTRFLSGQSATMHYMLFTKAADDWPRSKIEGFQNISCRLIALDNVLDALRKVSRDSAVDILEIVDAYESALKDLYERRPPKR